MKRIYTCLLLMVLSFNGTAQIRFEPGYFIDNHGQRTDCLIKNVDWKNNPVSFFYKTSEEAQPLKAVIDSVMEFGVPGTSKYIRVSVDIDRSVDVITEMSSVRNPVYTREVLFLKVLVEGKAVLYSYTDVNLVRYFYTCDTSGIKQLTYKTYKTPEFKIGINNDFRQQLWLTLKCPDISMDGISNTGYNKNDLVRLFNKYNNCFNSKSITIESPKKKDLFNLNIRPGVCFSSLSITNSLTPVRDAAFNSRPGFILGIEAEFVMPFLRNKWSVIMEPGIMFLNTGKEIENDRFDVEYKSLEVPIGIRHYFFLNDNTRIFINASLNLNTAIESGIYFKTGSKLRIESMENLTVGAGCKYNSRYSIEVRYGFNRNILLNYRYWNSEYKSFSVILGYTLF